MNKPKNHVAFVLDRSGSMDALRRETVRAFNALAEEIRLRSAEGGQETSVTLVTFANTARVEFLNADVRTLRPLAESSYRPDGMTALFDGVGLAVTSLRGLPDAGSPDVSFLVLVVTDGEENNSLQYRDHDVVRLLRETQSTDRWSFAFQLPPGRSADFCRRFGIASDNVREWRGTAEGVEQATGETRAGLANYFAARSRGQRSVGRFYVTTDMSGVDAGTVRANLDDLSDRFRLLSVAQEAAVREFVEAKTGRPYVVGSAYYLLMKPEKVQPRKEVLIMEKGKKAVWGGPLARDLIGLPRGAEAKVCPGNHANYDIFVQSCSVNRRLPRGTKVLIDTAVTKGGEPTWVPKDKEQV